MPCLSLYPTEWRYAARDASIYQGALTLDCSVGYLSGARLNIRGLDTRSARSCGDRGIKRNKNEVLHKTAVSKMEHFYVKRTVGYKNTVMPAVTVTYF